MRKYPVSTKNTVLCYGSAVMSFPQARSCVTGLVLSRVLFGQELEARWT